MHAKCNHEVEKRTSFSELSDSVLKFFKTCIAHNKCTGDEELSLLAGSLFQMIAVTCWVTPKITLQHLWVIGEFGSPSASTEKHKPDILRNVSGWNSIVSRIGKEEVYVFHAHCLFLLK